MCFGVRSKYKYYYEYEAKFKNDLMNVSTIFYCQHGNL